MSLKTELNQFTCTEQWYKHPFGLLYTDGVKFLAEKAGAYWLIDAIASYQSKYKNKCPFQIWELSVNDDDRATLTMRENSNQPAQVTQEVGFTDFPFKHIKLYSINGVLLLPSEY